MATAGFRRVGCVGRGRVLRAVTRQPRFAGSKAAVLGFYGALDSRVTGSEPAAKAALDRAGLVNDLVVEPDADHAFFNDTGPRYNAAAAADAWQRLLDWFGRYLVAQ